MVDSKLAGNTPSSLKLTVGTHKIAHRGEHLRKSPVSSAWRPGVVSYVDMVRLTALRQPQHG
jgi:hypothetical protein